MLVAEGLRAGVECGVKPPQLRRNCLRQIAEFDRLLFPREPVGELRDPGVEVFRAELEAERYALLFPLVKFPPRTHAGAVVYLDAHTQSFKFSVELIYRGEHPDSSLVVGRAVDGDNHDLMRREAGRHHQTLVVAVTHDEPADKPC